MNLAVIASSSPAIKLRKKSPEYIEISYDRQRTQARLDYLSPAAITQRFHIE